MRMHFIDICTFDQLQDHHAREGECLFGIPAPTADCNTVGDTLACIVWQVPLSDHLPEGKPDSDFIDAARLYLGATSEGWNPALPVCVIPEGGFDPEVMQWFFFRWES